MMKFQMETSQSTGGAALPHGTERRGGVFSKTVPRFFSTELDAARPLRLVLLHGSGLHSSTFQLNVSAFCGIGGASRVC